MADRKYMETRPPLQSSVRGVSRGLAVAAAVGLIVLLSSCTWKERDNLVRDGYADLRQVNFWDHSLVRLNGDWRFWPSELIAPADVSGRLERRDSSVMKVPGSWQDLGLFEPADNLMTMGTLALALDLPPGEANWAVRLTDAYSACSLYANGDLIAEIGSVSSDPRRYIPRKGCETGLFSTKDGKVLLVMHVVNFSLPHTGTWDSPRIGTVDTINKKRTTDSIRTSLVSGAMIFMGLYHLVLFLLSRKNKTALVFSAICILMALRNLMMGERIMVPLFSPTEIGWRLSYVVEHLSVHMCIALFFAFFRMIFPNEVRKAPLIAIYSICAAWAFLRIFTPPMFCHRILPYFECFVLVAALYALFVVVIAALYGREGAVIILIGVGLMVITVANDVLLSNGLIESVYLTSFGMFLFTFSQSFFLSRQAVNISSALDRNVRDLERLNTSLERFIPKEMLNYLGKESIVEVQLGNFIEEQMSVFFLDIRNFTTRSEAMSPDENFRFINTFLEQFGPLVRKHGGFIDKYLGDGFMALFPGDADNALDAALDMRECLGGFNAFLQGQGYPPVRFGIGVHTGPLMLGTIGESLRMDTTVISDTVNTASRLEQMNKTFKTDILISEETWTALRDKSRYNVKKLSQGRVKGRTKIIRIYALISGFSETGEPLWGLASEDITEAERTVSEWEEISDC